jgi:Mrp family chromosome partitioning ATPase
MAELASERMRRIVQDARQTFDWIIVDTPPLTLVADASLIVSIVDGAVLVVRAASTSLDLAKRAVETLGRPKVLGVVLNASRRPQDAGYGYDPADYCQGSEYADPSAEGQLR